MAESSYLLYIVDGVLALLFLLTVVNAVRVGLARSVAGIAAWVLAAALALHFCAPVAQWAYDAFVQPRVTQAVRDNVSDMADAADTVDITTAILRELPDGVVEAARSMNIDVDALMRKTSSFDPHADHIADAVEREVLAPILLAALKALAFFAIILLVTAVVHLLLSPAGKALHKLPVIGHADRGLGGVLGILKGAVLVSVLAMLLRVAAGIVGGSFGAAVGASKIVAFVADSPFSDGLFRSS